MSLSATTWSRPTRCPSKRADGPHTRAAAEARTKVVVDPVRHVRHGRTGMERERLLVDRSVLSGAGRGEAGQRQTASRNASSDASSMIETETTSRSGKAARDGGGRPHRLRRPGSRPASPACRCRRRRSRPRPPRARQDRRRRDSSRRSHRPSGGRPAAPGRRRGPPRRPRSAPGSRRAGRARRRCGSGPGPAGAS